MEIGNIQELWSVIGAYALTGVIVTTLIQVTKEWISSRRGKVFWAIIISLAAGVGIYFLNLLPGSWLVMLAGIYGSANTFYLLFFKSKEDKGT
ncbi:MAG: hypothetical protein KJI72_00275 [Patescibacteria group bacterium]|nr:hypothetical protein [Patescibacteria group bacterium]